MGRACRPLLVGEPSVWRRAGWRPSLAPLHDTSLGERAPAFGAASALTGKLSYASLVAATRLAARKVVAGVVTAPISKAAWDAAGVPYRDHTSFLERETGSPGTEMVLGLPEKDLWCVLATRHVPLAEAPRLLTPGRVAAAARALDIALRRLGRAKPRLGLCALNPHGGEGGLLGDEERRVLAPALRLCGGLDLAGPIPADAAWRLHSEGGLDGLVCLYHDQALIPLKVAGGLSGVNWTVGIPFVRVSPAHGTAFDAAGKGKADASGTEASALLAARLART